MNRTLSISLLALLSTTAQAASQATLEPSVVAPGMPATLRIVTDTGATPQVPAISGADIYAAGQSSQITILNGAVTRQATYSFQIVPHDAGDRMIGPIRVGPDTTQPLQLRVDPSAAPQARGRPSTPAPAPSARAAPSGDRAFLRLWLGDDTPYVGQSVPLTVSAYLRRDVGGTLEGIPSLTAADFVLDGMEEEPSRSEVDIEGQTYTRFTWTASLTPVREGTYPLSTELPATLQWVEQKQVQGRRRGSLLDEMLANDPFFRNSGFSRMLGGFGGGFSEPEVVSRKVVLKANRGAIEVLPPPIEGRPDGFTGAVGQFELALEGLPSEAAVGEPIELRWSVKGTGNIAALTMAGVPAGDGYKTYPPETHFEPSVRSGTKGRMQFTQLIVPKQPGELHLPDLSLSFLDPKTDAYQTTTASVPTVQVSGTAVASTEAAATKAGVPTPPDPTRVHAFALPATARHGIFWLAPLVWMLLLGSWFGRSFLSDRLGRFWAWIITRWQRRTLRRRMRSGIHQADEERFFRAGLMLVEQHPHPQGDGVRSFLNEADRSLYARVEHDPDTLDTLYQQLIHDLDQKEAA